MLVPDLYESTLCGVAEAQAALDNKIVVTPAMFKDHLAVGNKVEQDFISTCSLMDAYLAHLSDMLDLNPYLSMTITDQQLEQWFTTEMFRRYVENNEEDLSRRYYLFYNENEHGLSSGLVPNVMTYSADYCNSVPLSNRRLYTYIEKRGVITC